MRVLRKYITVFKLAMESAMEYRADFIMSIVSGGFSIAIQFFMWTAIYGGAESGSLFGYDYGQMVVYVIMAGILSCVMATGFERDIAEDIKSGGLSKYLVQPIKYMSYRVAYFFGGKSVQLVIITLLSVAALVIVDLTIGINYDLANTGYLLLSVLLGLMLNFLLFYCFSALAFWMTDCSAVFTGLQVTSNILSGGVFPLEVFGAVTLSIFGFLPFQYVIYFPLQILSGRCTAAAELWRSLGMQAAWVVGLTLLAKLFWSRGMKKYIAAGG